MWERIRSVFRHRERVENQQDEGENGGEKESGDQPVELGGDRGVREGKNQPEGDLSNKPNPAEWGPRTKEKGTGGRRGKRIKAGKEGPPPQKGRSVPGFARPGRLGGVLVGG